MLNIAAQYTLKRSLSLEYGTDRRAAKGSRKKKDEERIRKRTTLVEHFAFIVASRMHCLTTLIETFDFYFVITFFVVFCFLKQLIY